MKIVSPFTSTLKTIKKQFIDKEKLNKSTLTLQKKEFESKRKNSERQRFINYESKLEKTLSFIGKPLKKTGKKLGFLESLKQFILNVLMGFIAVRLLKYLPQLLNVFKIMLRVSDFILDMSGKLLNGLVTFVDKGYQAADHARKLVKSIGGQQALDSLDGLNNQTNSLLNSILIAGMLFSDFGGVGSGIPAASQAVESGTDIIQQNIKGELATKAAEQSTKVAARAAIGPLGAAGIVLGAGLLSSALGEGIYQIKKYSKGLNQFGPLSAIFRVPISLLSGVGTLLDVIGAPFRYGVELIRAAVMKLNNNKKGLEEQNKNLGKFDARVRDNIREGLSIFAPVFTFFKMDSVANKLQTPGSFGSLYGQKAVKDMGYYGGGMVVQKFAGGGYAQDNKSEKVEIPRTFKEKQSTLEVGSAVGGMNLMTQVFPSSSDDKSMNPYEYMVSSYYYLSDAGALSPLMSLTAKSILGDKINDKDYSEVSSSLSSLLLTGLYEENKEAYNQIYSSLGNQKFKSIIEQEIAANLRDKFSQIQNQLRIQLGLLPPPGVAKESEADPCAAACDTGGGSGVAVYGDATDKAILDLISSVEAKDYDTMNVSRGRTAGKPTQMTVSWLASNANGAIGRYQQMPQYVLERVIAAGGKGSDKFTPELQDRTALKMLYSGHGYARWRSGQMSDEEFGNRLSATWRGLPHSSGGTYPDEYAGRNKAHMSRPAFMARLAQIKKGTSPSTAKIAPGSPAANVDPCICDPETPDGSGLTMGAESVSTSVSGVVNPVPSQNIAANKGGYAADTGLDILTPIGSKVVASVSGILEYAEKGHVAQMGQDANPNMPGQQDQHSVRIKLDKPFSYKGKTVNFFYATHLYELSSAVKNKSGIKINAGTPLGLSGVANKVPHVHVGYVADRNQTSFLNYLEVKSMLSSARQSGGPTLSGGIRMLHEGEYVIDKDSVDLFGGISFFSMINGVENEKQRTEKSSQLIQHLSRYTGRKIDQRPEVIIEDDENEVIMPSPILSHGRSSHTIINNEINWEQDILSMRG